MQDVRHTYVLIEPESKLLQLWHFAVGGPPHPEIVTIVDIGGYIRISYIPFTGWRILLNFTREGAGWGRAEPGGTCSQDWIAVEQPNLSYYIGEIILMTMRVYIYMYTHYGNLTYVPQ